jgi:hypothetical protein
MGDGPLVGRRKREKERKLRRLREGEYLKPSFKELHWNLAQNNTFKNHPLKVTYTKTLF